MISSLTGEIYRVDEDRVHLRVGPIICELLVPAADVIGLQSRVGDETTFHTIFYIEGDSSGGSMLPRLIGFLRPQDKSFFEMFITVKGIGPKKALRALALPVGEIARAIESKDARFLVGLPQIGKRMAELIVAELAGKVQDFATPYVEGASGVLSAASKRSAAEEDAIAALLALGERRSEAEQLLDRAKHSKATLKTTADYLNEMLRMRTARA